jgi:hypothetical protein
VLPPPVSANTFSLKKRDRDVPRRAAMRSSRSRTYAVGSKRPAGDGERRADCGRDVAGDCPRLEPLLPAGVCVLDVAREAVREVGREVGRDEP